MRGRGIDDLDASDAIGRWIVLSAIGRWINVSSRSADPHILAVAAGAIHDDLNSIFRISRALEVPVARLVNADVVVVTGKREGDERFAGSVEEQSPQFVQAGIVPVAAPAQAAVVREKHATLTLTAKRAGQPCDLAVLGERPFPSPLAPPLALSGVEEDEPPAVEVAEMFVTSPRLFCRVYSNLGCGLRYFISKSVNFSG